jgi:hypothetical protein
VEWSEKRGQSASKVRLFHDAAKIGLDLFKFKFGADDPCHS